jgi:tetratricopeptide (TPR) repeat protein
LFATVLPNVDAAQTDSYRSLPPGTPMEYVAYVKTNFAVAQARHRAEPNDVDAAWRFGQASFDRADLATNSTERAAIAEEGIAACEIAVTHGPKVAAGHYYLGMNLGQLAQTKTLGALRIVKRMETEFISARGLDEQFDHAGPDRNLGLLYREAPTVLSIGNRKDAQRHLLRAAQLAPGYPENLLNLIEAYLKWSELPEARPQLKALEILWPAAQTNFVGVEWSASWVDWGQRRVRARKALE